jgi:hypothetical protein
MLGRGPDHLVCDALLAGYSARSRTGDEYDARLIQWAVQTLTVTLLVLVSGWSDNGWLSGGHAVRMAMELCTLLYSLDLQNSDVTIQQCTKLGPNFSSACPNGGMATLLPKRTVSLLSHRGRGSVSTCLNTSIYPAFSATRSARALTRDLYNRMSYGTGRPAVLKDDESIWNCRMLLQHPLAIEDDMRLVSTVELMAIRERITNKLGPYDQPVDDHTFEVLREADRDFQTWYNTWDVVFSHKYEDAGRTDFSSFSWRILILAHRQPSTDKACKYNTTTLNSSTMPQR